MTFLLSNDTTSRCIVQCLFVGAQFDVCSVSVRSCRRHCIVCSRAVVHDTLHHALIRYVKVVVASIDVIGVVFVDVVVKQRFLLMTLLVVRETGSTRAVVDQLHFFLERAGWFGVARKNNLKAVHIVCELKPLTNVVLCWVWYMYMYTQTDKF